MPITFKTDTDTGVSTGVTAPAAIQPITNGEPVNQTTLRRPSENLRVRTETLKTAALSSETRETEDAGAFIYSEGGTCSIVSTPFEDNVIFGIPAVTVQEFLPELATSIIVTSPAIPGGKVILKKADFTSFYSEGGNGDHHLAKRGDCIALKLPRSGANIRALRTWGNDLDYPGIADGNIAPEAELVKLPSRIILNTPGKTLLTTLGPDGTGDFDADGVPEEDCYVWLTSVAGQADGWWLSQGGSGDFSNDDFLNKLTVTRITETTIECATTTPWRILWPETEAGINWALGELDFDGEELATGTDGYITAKDYSDYHIIPLITYTGTGFVFSPSGGFLPNIPARLLSFSLPISDVADLASEAAVDEGGAAIGSFVKSSSGDVDDTDECGLNGGVQIVAGTLSAQLTALCKATAQRTRAMTLRALTADISVAQLSKSLPLASDGKAYVSTDERLVRVWFTIETAFDVSNDAQPVTLSIGYLNANAVFTALQYPDTSTTLDLTVLEPGFYEVPLSSNMYAWVPVQIGGAAPQLYAKFICGGAAMTNVTAGIIQVGAMVREVP